MIACTGCGAEISPEDEWPGVCRLQTGGAPSPDDPRLTLAGDFKSAGEEGDRRHAQAWQPLLSRLSVLRRRAGSRRRGLQAARPEMAALGKFGVEVSQIATPAIGLTQIVAAWASAVADPDKMTAFRCDRWRRRAAHRAGPGILDRCREDYALSVVPTGLPRFGGLDTGDRLWLVARESESAFASALHGLSNSVRRPPASVCPALRCARPHLPFCRYRQRARDGARHRASHQPARQRAADPRGKQIRPHRLRRRSRSGTARAGAGFAPRVEFSLKPGGGIVHELRLTQEGHAYPVIRANRDETIQRAIDEFLCYDDGLVAVVDGKIRTAPVMRMPAACPVARRR